MERELKFRAICDFEIKGDLQPRAMVYFGAQEFDDGIKAWPMPCTMDKICSHESPIMQYIGLKDKNGKEIYEGDIVKCVANNDFKWPAKGFVEYLPSAACFAINVGRQSLDNDNCYYAHFSSHLDFEVVGNIYEHLLTPVTA